jgi:hypothetical protein
MYQISDEGAEELWLERGLGRAFQTFVAKDGYAYGFSSIKRGEQPLMCIDLSNGKEVWRQELCRWGALSLSDGKLVVITGDTGELIVAEASPNRYTELHRSEGVTMHSNEGLQDIQGNFCWTNPTLADDKLFLRSNYGDITCFSID